MTAEELIDKSIGQRKQGRIEEALISARSAASLDPEDAEAFWQLAICQEALSCIADAQPHLEKVVELAPRFAHGWTKLGLALRDTKQEDRAIKCFERAIALDENEPLALSALAPIYERNEASDDEQRILLLLERHSELTIWSLNRLGILHRRKGDFYPAIKYFRRVANGLPDDPAGFLNLGWVYSAPEVGQLADAIDIWRHVLSRWPDNERAAEDIARLLPKLTQFRQEASAFGASVLNIEQHYSVYVSPLELLNFDEDIDFEDLDTKTLLQKRKALLHEIELEDGRVAWVDGLQIDRSKVLGICDELLDDYKREYHFHVFANKSLSSFLQRGDLSHFLVDAQESPLSAIDLLESDPAGFGAWLSPIFATQFDAVLAKAIDERNFVALRCLLSGRRWVRPEHEDLCFESGHRRIDRLLDPLRRASESSPKVKPTLSGIQLLLSEYKLNTLLGLLPDAFHKEKREAAMLIRGISVDAYNHHGDADLAKAILQLTMAFAATSPSLRDKLAEDEKILDEKIAAQRKDEAHLTFGKVECSITREGVRHGKVYIPIEEVRTIRWGMLTTGTGPTRSISYRMNIGGVHGALIGIDWNSTQNQEKQTELFGKLTNAALSYLLPKIMSSLQLELEAQRPVNIGGLAISKAGVEFVVSSWFSTKKVFCSWQRLRSVIANGEVVVSDPENHKAKASLPLREVDNAIVLHFLSGSSS